MELSVKTCMMCRKDVDAVAKLCPYCKSDVDYAALLSISPAELIKNKNIAKEFILILVGLAMIFAGFGTGYMLGGFWIGVFGGLLGHRH